MVILIDNGSTYNFLDTVVVQKCKLALQMGKPILVHVANGEILNSEWRSTTVQLLMQEVVLSFYFFTLSSRGCDVVMEIQ